MSLHSGSDLPAFTETTEWLIELPSLVKGRPVLVHFWSVSCPLCHENMEVVTAWKRKFAPHGLQFVSIHKPFKDNDHDLDAVRSHARELEIDEPCGHDEDLKLSAAFGCEYAPEYFLFDGHWKLKGRAAGLFGLNTIALALEKMYPAI